MCKVLLTTKLNIPRRRPDLVPRPGLIARLDEGLRLGHRLALVSAPAGFGKTTLVSEWLHHVQAQHAAPLQVAWLSLDEGDSDPARFVVYLVAALRSAGASLGQETLAALQAPGTAAPTTPPTIEAILTPLINELAVLPERVLLVLDDYHLVGSPAVDNALAFLIEHQPASLHLLIATREDPHLPLARLRGRGQLTELRAADLRFTSAEAAAFLNRAMGLNLEVEQVAALESRTEGWIAGLHLAAISMRGCRDTARFVASFTGSHRFVLDYLIEEVLGQQTESVQSFLMQTAILDRLSGPLCDAVRAAGTATGEAGAVRLDWGAHGTEDGGQSILDWLEHTNLFVVPLDGERQWYRYHHLFADLLRQRLHQVHPEWVAPLHQRASAWFERNGFVDKAIDHALRAADLGRAANLMEAQADGAWRLGEHTKLRHWLDALPREAIRAQPRLCVYHTWYLFTSGHQDEAEQALQACEEALDVGAGGAAGAASPYPLGSVSDAERQTMRGRAAVIRAFIATYMGDVPAIIHHACHALDLLPEEDLGWRRDAAMALGDAQGFRGDLEAAYAARLAAAQASRSAGDVAFSLLAHLKLAITLREQGRLQQTIQLCQEQLEFARVRGLARTSAPGGFLAIWGETLAELGDLDGAFDLVTRGQNLVEQSAESLVAGWAYLCLARVLFSRGDSAGSAALARKVERSAPKPHIPPWVASEMEAWKARLWLAQGNVAAASRWARQRGLVARGEPRPVDAFDFFSLNAYGVLARILLARQRWDRALSLLSRLLAAAEAGGRTAKVIEILGLQAMAHEATGNARLAHAALEKALTLGEPEGFVQSFVDQGPPVARLLGETTYRGAMPGYVSRLLAAFEPEGTGKGPVPAPVAATLVEPLSERELEVLGRIAEGLTNREIATRLFLSLNTVKSHTRNIYGKLGVHSRTQAIARAGELGILPSR